MGQACEILDKWKDNYQSLYHEWSSRKPKRIVQIWTRWQATIEAKMVSCFNLMWMSYVIMDNFKDAVHRWVFHVKEKEG
jgi:hypothetical protein